MTFFDVRIAHLAYLYKEYEKAPDVTRNRLYLEAMEQVMSDASKIVIDNDGSSSLMYLPLDKLLEKSHVRRTFPRPLSTK